MRRVVQLVILAAAVLAAVEHLYLSGALERWLERASDISLFGAPYVR
jgi:hypothetical protein